MRLESKQSCKEDKWRRCHTRVKTVFLTVVQYSDDKGCEETANHKSKSPLGLTFSFSSCSNLRKMLHMCKQDGSESADVTIMSSFNLLDLNVQKGTGLRRSLSLVYCFRRTIGLFAVKIVSILSVSLQLSLGKANLPLR